VDSDAARLVRMQASLQSGGAAQRTQIDISGRNSRKDKVTAPVNSLADVTTPSSDSPVPATKPNHTDTETDSETESTDPAAGSQTPFLAMTIDFKAWSRILNEESTTRGTTETQLTKEDMEKIRKAYNLSKNGQKTEILKKG
jgi:hypothetical protein